MLPLSLLLALDPAHAADVTVLNSADLQGALDQVGAGDTITLAVPGGVQGVNVSVQKNAGFTITGGSIGPTASITVTVASGNNGQNALNVEDVAFLGDGATSNAGLRVYGKNVNLTNVTFSNYGSAGVGFGSAFEWDGGVDNVVVMENVSFVANRGNAAVITGGDLEVYNSAFTANGNQYEVGQDFIYGGGLYFDGDDIILGEAYEQGGEVVKRGNTFSNNIAVFGGGAYIRANSGTIAANRFEYNVSNDFNRYNDRVEALTGSDANIAGVGLGGGAYIESGGNPGPMEVKWNTFVGNWGWDGAGVHIQNPEEFVFENNLVAQNWAVHSGGGLSIIHNDSTTDSRPRINNNTLTGNVAGLTRVFLFVQVVGAGGNARIEGLIPEFKNNVVSHAPYGGGILGMILDGPFEAGDDFNTWFRSNLFYFNCDVFNCFANDPGDKPLTGNYDQYALHPSNIEGIEPDYIYFGDPREPGLISDNDAYPDEFCLDAFSVGIRAGDEDLPNLGDPSYGSDLGHCGGVQCFFWNRDRDGDGWLQHQDCLDDPNAADRDPGAPAAADINPDAEEVCDYEDNNCNGTIDEGFINQYWPDADGDGGGKEQDPGVLACDITDLPNGGAGYAANNLDCADDDPLRSGTLGEECDGIDNDCDDIVNEEEEVGGTLKYPDADGDGFGAEGLALAKYVCQDGVGDFYLITPEGEESIDAGLPPFSYKFVDDNTDCNDTDPTFKPGAPEVCDDRDHNCNNDHYDVTSSAGELYYLDTDGDGWGDLNTVVTVCSGQPLPEGNYVLNGGDCDENNPLVNNGADEVCDGIDNDCNAIIDDNPVDGQLRYEDYDNDGFGNPATALRACPGTHGATYTATVGGDCDDNDAGVGECSECGCHAAPTTGSVGLLGTGLLALFGLRRRR